MAETDLVARTERLEPWDDLQEYGCDVLLADLIQLDRADLVGGGLDQDLVTALRRSDVQGAEQRLPAVRDRLRSGRDHQVLASGTVTAHVPILVAAAPDVPGVEVAAGQERSQSAGGELSFKIGGTGLGASAKVTVSQSQTLTCAPGEVLVASVALPVAWERRARLDNEDYNWVHTEMAPGDTTTPIVVRRSADPLLASVLSTLLVDTTAGGQEPFELDQSFACERGLDFSVGFKVDAIGLDTSLTVSTGSTVSIDLHAALPAGHRYQVAWLGGPWGVRVSLLD